MDYGEDERKTRCLECGDDISYGRRNKKFCCDKCKNMWHNKRAQGTRIAKSRVMTILNRNYSILNNMLESGCTSADLDQMRGMGFNFDYCTSYRKVRRHDEFFCFDIAFTIVASEVVSIRKLPVVSRKMLKIQNV